MEPFDFIDDVVDTDHGKRKMMLDHIVIEHHILEEEILFVAISSYQLRL
jgi:hypothetical protein